MDLGGFYPDQNNKHKHSHKHALCQLKPYQNPYGPFDSKSEQVQTIRFNSVLLLYNFFEPKTLSKPIQNPNSYRMKACLFIVSLIVLFVVFEIFLENVRDRVLDVAIPVLLMGGFVFALRFLFLTPFPRCIWLRWVIVLVLCAAFYFSFDKRALIHPRSRREDIVCRYNSYDLQWKEDYFKSEESYKKQSLEKIDLEKNLSILKNENDVLQKQCIEEKNTLTINSETEKKLASEELEFAKRKIQELERRCRDDRS